MIGQHHAWLFKATNIIAQITNNTPNPLQTKLSS